jgi:thymidylate synthase (FAD)
LVEVIYYKGDNKLAKVILIEHTPDPDKVVATAARLCYSPSSIEDIMSNFTPEKIEKFVAKLADMGHESPFEHVSFTFGIEDISRSLTHQLVRHRLASYSQQSQRYVIADMFKFIIPPAIETIPLAKEVFEKQMRSDQEAYNSIFEMLVIEYVKDYMCKNNIEPPPDKVLTWPTWFKENYKQLYSSLEKKAAEDARYVLPNAAETKIIATMNARELFSFFYHRCCNRAQWEIRAMANEMLRLAKEVAPKVFNNAGRACVVNGYCPEGDMQCDQFKDHIATIKDVKSLIAKYYIRGGK